MCGGAGANPSIARTAALERRLLDRGSFDLRSSVAAPSNLRAVTAQTPDRDALENDPLAAPTEIGINHGSATLPRNGRFEPRGYAVPMAIYYIGRTALDFWRWKASTLSSLENPQPMRRLTLSNSPVQIDEAIEGCTAFHRNDHDIEVMVAEKHCAHTASGIRHTICTRKLPPHAFARLNAGRYVATPEFLFATLAKRIDLVGLYLLGCELTGTYALAPSDARGFLRCDPLSTRASHSRMIGNMAGFPGIKRAAMALGGVLENAASPMETCVSLLLTLPCRLGGYGLPKPLLNHKIPLTREQSYTLKRQSIVADMAWPKKHFAIEYESTAWHSGDDKFIHDSIRRNDIRSLGYDVITITLDEYKSVPAMDRIACDIASKVGYRLRLSRIDRSKQDELRRDLRQRQISDG